MRYGYFDDENKEYVVINPATPTPWINYLGEDEYCTIISANAGGYSFFKTPKNERVTRYRFNNLPMDRPGKYIYLKENKNFWTLSWQPVGSDLKEYKTETRVGLGYTKIISEYLKIKSEVVYFVPPNLPLEIWDIKILNVSNKKRKLDIIFYCEFAFWNAILDLTNYQWSLNIAIVRKYKNIVEYTLGNSKSKSAYMFTSCKLNGFIGERDKFIGLYNDESKPYAIMHNRWPKKRLYEGGNPAGILKSKVTLNPKEEKRIAVVVGIGRADKEGKKMKKYFQNLKNIDLHFNTLKKQWDERIDCLKVDTPDKIFNSYVNIWGIYQAYTCFNWSRSTSIYETGTLRDGLGFRDSCQDTFGVVHVIPYKVKKRILQLASAIYKDGSACHTFQPLEGMGNGGGFSDDHLWLILAVDSYLKETADFSILDCRVPYFDGGEDSLFEHLKKIIEFSLNKLGPNGLSLGLQADWNDCLNLKDGESVFTSELLYKAMNLLAEISKKRNEISYAEFLINRAAELKTAINNYAWDGEWYVRGILPGEKKIGSKENKYGKIFLESNAWAVISGITNDERAKITMNSVFKYLYTKYGVKLLSPAYKDYDPLIGLSDYPPGMKENGAIFCHAHSWAIIAEALLGNTERAYEYFMSICPAKFNDEAEKRKTEPYVFSQFIASDESLNFGESRNSWLTGTASWMYVAATQYILGIRPELDGLFINPCIPKQWQGFEVIRKFRNAKYRIIVTNMNNTGYGVSTIKIDNKPTKTNLVPAFSDNSEHIIEVTLGK